MKTWEKYYEVPCGCGDKQCGKLSLHFCGRNVLDIGFIPYRHKKVKFGVVLSNKELDIFRRVVAHQRDHDENFKETPIN
jgi:hypothetical protein